MNTKQKILSITSKDCRFDYFVGSGKGGQKRNRTANCARCTHIASGAVGEGKEGRSQRENKEKSFERMAKSEKFQKWLKVETSRIMGKEAEIEKQVERQMSPSNLKIETKNEKGLWKEELCNH